MADLCKVADQKVTPPTRRLGRTGRLSSRLVQPRSWSFRWDPKPSQCIDLSGGILADYEPEELGQVANGIGEPYAVYISCQSMDAARAFLRGVLLGLEGLVDTNYDEILRAGGFLMLVERCPGWDWRRQLSMDLQ